MGIDFQKEQDSTEIVAVVDRSGSMESIKHDAIGGFNTFLDGQKSLPGKATFTLIKFDDEIDVEYSGVNLKLVKPFTTENFVPRGTTALYDAIGRGIEEAASRGEDRKVIVAIVTDGMENASTKYRKHHIQELINRYEAKGWVFLFLAAGFSQHDAEVTAMGLGLKASSSVGVSRDSMHAVYGCVSDATSSYRSTGSIGASVKSFIKKHL